MEGSVEWRAPGAPRWVTAPCKRKLLHWINSLPPPPCLLVEQLADLRFGDVLAAVVAWLEGASYDGQRDDARTAVTAAVDYVARQCCLIDDALAHVVNGARCVARVLDGDEDTIAIVVAALKGLAEQREQARRDAAQRRGIESRRAVASALEAVDAAGVRAARRSDSGQVTPRVVGVVQSRGRGRGAATETAEHGRERAQVKAAAVAALPSRHSDRKARVKRHAGVRESAAHGRHGQLSCSTECDTAGTLEWMKSLGVPHSMLQISAKSDSHDCSVFQDGVALCALAAAIAQRHGGVSIRHKLQTHHFGGERSKGLFPRGATLKPRSAAEKRHNLSVAWGLLRECKALPRSLALDCPAFVAVASADGSGDHPTIWSVLKALRDQTKAHTLTKVAPVPPLLSLYEEKPQRRPYITVEQIETVKRWMKHNGVNPAEISSGILQNSLRNGVALCAVLNEVEIPHAVRITYKNPPKTLHEVRDNIKKAIHAAAGLRAMNMPRAYASVHAVEAILMGDKQYVFGILWHVMQCVELAKAQTVKTLPAHEVDHTDTKILQQESKSSALLPPNCTRPPSSAQPAVTLQLDVPAGALLEDEAPSSTNSVGSVPWVEAEDHEDIFPVFKREPPRRYPIDHSVDMNDLQPRQTVPPPSPVHHVTFEESSATKRAMHPEETVSLAQEPNSPKPQGQDTNENARYDYNNITESGKDKHTSTTKKSEAIIQFSHKQVERIRLWLESIGVSLQHPHDLHNGVAVLSEFSSGVLLCSIVEKLEHMRCMEGVCRDEKISRPKALHNITKALGILEQQKVIPPQLARRRLDVYEGKRATMLLLLSAMCKTYGYRSIPPVTTTSKKR